MDTDLFILDRYHCGHGSRKVAVIVDAEPAKPLVVTEHWTLSRSAVTLTGTVATLREIAHLLNLPEEMVIVTRLDHAVLGIWGDILPAYEELKRAGRVTVRQ